jgi:hypothetical protein
MLTELGTNIQRRMKKLLQLVQRAKKLNTGKIFLVTFKNQKVKDIVVSLNTEGQLRFGILGDGGQLPDYSKVSKDLFGKPDGPIQLYDTGALYRSTKVVNVTKNGFTIFINTLKTDDEGQSVDLAQRYEDFGTIPGLTIESKKVLKKHILPLVIAQIKSELLHDNR